MAFSSQEGTAPSERADGLMAEITGSSWGQPEQPARDWKKLALVVGLGVLSWVATYVGMLELIEANMGELPLVQ